MTAATKMPDTSTPDANGRNVLLFYALLLGGLALVLAVSALTLQLFTPPAPLIAKPHFPEPALQSTPLADLQAHRAAETALANVYGWVDRDHGIVRIPITQAMQRMQERGLDETTAQVRR